MQDPGFRALLTLTLVLLLVGMFFYRQAEGWTLFQSLYFSVITLTTARLTIRSIWSLASCTCSLTRAP